jgi:hypothetical protein
MGLKFSVDGRYCLVTNLKMDISLYLTAYLKKIKKFLFMVRVQFLRGHCTIPEAR